MPLAVATDCEQYLHERLTLLEAQLATVNRMAAANDLPDAIITESGLKITPLDAAVPDTAQALIDQTAMVLPHVKITELLLEVDEWTGFTRHFTHLKSGDLAKDKNLLLTTIPADAINPGLTKMAESCPGTTYAKLAWLQARIPATKRTRQRWLNWSTLSFGIPLPGTGAMAPHHHRTDRISEPLARQRARGTSTQNMAAAQTDFLHPHLRPIRAIPHQGGQCRPARLNLRARRPAVPRIRPADRGALHRHGGLHRSRLRPDAPLGLPLRAAHPRPGDTKLYIPKGDAAYDALKPMIGGTLNIKHVRAHWDEILRLATSIKQGTVTASLMLRKLGSYPRQNGLAVALRELGRIERTLFILDWLQSVELRRRVHAGLNKGEARNALARAVFFNRLGEIRDRSFEQQRYRASGLNPVTAAIVLWNTVYPERAAHALRGNGHAVDDSLLQYLSPLGWEHINLTGDYLWRSSAKIGAGSSGRYGLCNRLSVLYFPFSETTLLWRRYHSGSVDEGLSL